MLVVESTKCSRRIFVVERKLLSRKVWKDAVLGHVEIVVAQHFPFLVEAIMRGR